MKNFRSQYEITGVPNPWHSAFLVQLERENEWFFRKNKISNN